MPDEFFQKIRLLAVYDVCQILKISKKSVQKLAREKVIPAQKIASGWVFSARDIEEYRTQRIAKSKTDKRIRIQK